MFRLPTNNRFTIHFLLGLTCFSVIVLLRVALTSPVTHDTWLHMGIGRYILEHRRIPTHIDISLKQTSPSLEWVSHTWLSDLILYLSAGANTQLGAILLLPAILILTLYLVNECMKLQSVSLPVRLITLIIGATITSTFWKLHPYLFVPSLFLGLLYILLLWRHFKSPHILISIPFLIYLWANIAGGLLFIPILFIAFFALATWIETTMQPKHKKDTSHSRIYIIFVWIASIITTILTPNGMRVPIYNLTVIELITSRKWFSTLAGTLEATNTNITKFTPSSTLYVFVLLYCLVTIGAVAYVLVTQRKKAVSTLLFLLPTLPFLLLSFYWIRFIPIGALVTLPLFAATITLCIQTWKESHPTVIKNGSILVLIGTSIYIGFLAIFPPAQITFHPPVEQLNMITDQRFSHSMLVSTDLVGYSYWRLYPSHGYFDAQDDLFDEHDTIAIYTAYNPINEETIQQLLKTYAMATVLVSKNNDYLTGYFSHLPDWSLLYFDTNGILFVKNDMVDPKYLSENALKYVDFSVDNGFDPKNLLPAITELERFTTRYPKNILAIGQLASLYRANNQLDHAEKTLMKIPGNQWNFVVETEMGRVKAAQGLCIQSESWFLKALKNRNEKNISRTTFDLAVLYALCFNDSAKAKHYFERYTSYPIPDFERQRATELMKRYVSDIIDTK